MTEVAAETLPVCLRATAARHPSRPALSFMDKTLTYPQLAGSVGALAASLSEMGVEAGERVAVLFPNCPQFVISYYAALQLGAVAVPLHCLQGPEETAYVLANSGAKTLLALNAFDPLIAGVRAHLEGLERIIISGESSLEDVRSFEQLLRPPGGPPPFVSGSRDDVAVLIYTSGTTGRPKGAMLTHDNLISDTMACRQVVRVDENDVFASVLPLFHSFGATVNMHLPILSGSHSVLIPKFAPLTVLEILEASGATFFAGVPSMFAVMLQMRTERRFDLSRLRLGVSGGAPMPVEVLTGFEERYGVVMVEGYGPTEASPVVSVNPPEGARKVGTVGPPLPGVGVKICDDDMVPLPPGEPGEVCVSGRTVMKGYWRDEAGTAEAIRDAWLLTGDIGYLDADGYLSIIDRKKDMIIVGGMNVYPREVEDVIYRLDEVAEVAVIGVPSRLRGEDVKAFIVLREGQNLTAQVVIDHCAACLANYKVPRTVEFRDELIKSGTGKVLKRVLREQEA